MHGLLRTPRLTLRPLMPEDAATSARIMSPAIARWTASWTGVETAEEVGGKIASSLEAERGGARLMRAITLAGTGELIGWAGVLRLGDDPERGSLGYWIGEAWFGQGYAKEAARAVVDAAWDALDIDVLEAAAQVGNHASHRILLGLGMRNMGQREEFARARGASDLCDWYELRRPGASFGEVS
jgi:ribosomal-protein-alanine N-acetyltransferase